MFLSLKTQHFQPQQSNKNSTKKMQLDSHRKTLQGPVIIHEEAVLIKKSLTLDLLLSN